MGTTGICYIWFCPSCVALSAAGYPFSPPNGLNATPLDRASMAKSIETFGCKCGYHPDWSVRVEPTEFSFKPDKVQASLTTFSNLMKTLPEGVQVPATTHRWITDMFDMFTYLNQLGMIEEIAQTDRAEDETFCLQCKSPIEVGNKFCTNCGTKTNEDSSTRFMGRGVRFVFAVSPKLTEDEFTLVKMIISGPSPFEGTGHGRSLNFASVDVTDYGRFVEEPEDNCSYIKVYCQGAKFSVMIDKAEEIYTDLFYTIHDVCASLCLQYFAYTHRVGMVLGKTGFGIMEFSLLHRIVPKEHHNEFMPLITLKTAGAYILWRKIAFKNSNEDILKLVSEQDREKLNTMLTLETDDITPMIAQNRDFIIKIAEVLGITEIFHSPNEVKRFWLRNAKAAIERRATMEAAMESGAEIFDHYMPLTDDELRVINEVKNSYWLMDANDADSERRTSTDS